MNPLVIDVAIRGSILIAAAAAATVVLHRASAATRHFVWTLTIVGLLVLPVLAAVLPAWEIAVPASLGRFGPPEGGSDRPGDGASLLDTRRAYARSPSLTGEVPIASEARVSSANDISWLMLLPVAYVLGVLLLLGRIIVQKTATRRIARDATVVTDEDWTRLLDDCVTRMGVERPVTLVRSRDQLMPMTIGTRTPAIVIPLLADTWDEDRRRAVLLHELAHISRHDCLTQLLAAVACALYWIHPGVWYVSRRLRVEREIACDDRVLTTGTQARDYAGHLLELAYGWSGRRAPALVVSMAGSRKLEGRMLALLDPKRNRATPTRRVWLAGAGLAVALLVPVAAVTMTTASASAAPQSVDRARVETPNARNAAQQNRLEASGQITPDGGLLAPAQGTLSGTWEITRDRNTDRVQARLTVGTSTMRTDVDASQLRDLSPVLLNADGQIRFRIPRDVGAFDIDGAMHAGRGTGTFRFEPSQAFLTALTVRGYARPTFGALLSLAAHDVGLELIDEFAAQKYVVPDLSLVVRAVNDGVDLDYLREMGQLGYKLGTVDLLVKMRDHGIDPNYIGGLRAEGLDGLSPHDLIRARDHGVDSNYVSGLRQLGYRFPLEGLIRTRDHGVDPNYITALRDAGYPKLSIEELLQARDHGVDAGYIRGMQQLGYRTTLPDLITARDHGVDPGYVKTMAAVGYKALPLGSLIRLRDHGVTPDYVQEAATRGLKNLSVDEIITLRDRGVASNNYRFERLVAHLRNSEAGRTLIEFVHHWVR